MSQNEAKDADHLRFLEWALSNGIELNGLAPCRFPGRGMGMIATRTIEADEIMLKVPVSTMLNIDSIPREFVDRFPSGTSIHGILAAFLTLGDPKLLDRWALWRKIWPSQQDFDKSLPLMWPGTTGTSSDYQIPLPPSFSGKWKSSLASPCGENDEDTYQNVLTHQAKRLQDSWEQISRVCPYTDYSVFRYNWFILNTRSFYYVSPTSGPPKDWNDAVGLVPFADYMNHTDNAPCEVIFDGESTTFRATARHEKGDEVFMNYGEHTNDYLLIEYGFFLDSNESDSIFLDDIIFPDLTSEDKEALRSHEYYCHFGITSSGPSPIVQIIASLKCMARKDWDAYALDPSSSDLLPEAKDLIRKWIKIYLDESTWAVKELESVTRFKAPGLPLDNRDLAQADQPISTILRRWYQIRDLCENALKAVV